MIIIKIVSTLSRVRILGLGNESTAHTFSCAVVRKKGRKGKILSDVRKIFRPEEGEGIHQEKHHVIILIIVHCSISVSG